MGLIFLLIWKLDIKICFVGFSIFLLAEKYSWKQFNSFKISKSLHDFEQVPGDSKGQGSLVCCSPWDRKESDMTEWLNWTEPQYFAELKWVSKSKLRFKSYTCIITVVHIGSLCIIMVSEFVLSCFTFFFDLNLFYILYFCLLVCSGKGYPTSGTC